jgi:hypothetical protein
MSFFEQMMGFAEGNYSQVQDNIQLQGPYMRSLINDAQYRYGILEIPTLQELRQRVQKIIITKKEPSSLSEVVANVQNLHCDAENEDCLFQVASQFNLLEMVGPTVSPERGVGCYEYDKTQGPACAISCAAGTIYRNYFVPLVGQIGQTIDNQIDCLADLESHLGGDLWTMQNGYALPSEKQIIRLNQKITNSNREELLGLLRAGLQWRTQVLINQYGDFDSSLRGKDGPLLVSQIYCSAVPVAYSVHSALLWEPFARLVLDAAYEATFASALINANRTGHNKLFLTLLGGGAFGNREQWIGDAIKRAFELYKQAGLEVHIVSYGSSSHFVQKLLEQIRRPEN